MQVRMNTRHTHGTSVTPDNTPGQEPRIKVLFVESGSGLYGAARSLIHLLGASVGIDPEVVCPNEGNLATTIAGMGIRVRALRFCRRSFRAHPFGHAIFMVQFRRILTRSKPDVLVLNSDGNATLAVLAAGKRTRIVRFCRTEFVPLRRRLDRYCWSRASAIISPSDHVATQLRESLPPAFDPLIHRLYDPLPKYHVPRVETEKRRLEFGLLRRPILACIARLHPAKQIETAIQAMIPIRARFPESLLVIVGDHDGSDGGRLYAQSLQGLVERLGLKSHVLMLGFRTDVPEILSASDLCVLPSATESFGMVLGEAWQQEVATVASAGSGCAEITLASQGGLLFAPGASDSLAKQATHILSMPQIAQSLGRAGSSWVAENCDPYRYAEKFLGILQQLK
jgi:glycosyltransferase involved in cell wall biosynthesis